MVSELTKLEKLRLEKGVVGENFGKLCTAHKLKQVELIDFKILPGFRLVLNCPQKESPSSCQTRPLDCYPPAPAPSFSISTAEGARRMR